MTKQRNTRKVRSLSFISTLAWSALCASILPAASFADMQSPPTEAKQKQCPLAAAAQQKTADAPTETADRRIYIDPQTGAITKPPASAPLTVESLPPDEAFNTSSEGLVETPSPKPEGGVSVNLQGRFRRPLVATQGADGKVTIQHMPQAPSSEKK